jgi:hypothetical protein
MAESQRLKSVQTPIIPVVGDLIRRKPGDDLRLGRGLSGIRRRRRRWRAVDGLSGRSERSTSTRRFTVSPELVAAIERKLRADNRIEVGGGTGIFVTAGGNMAFINALLADCRSRG